MEIQDKKSSQPLFHAWTKQTENATIIKGKRWVHLREYPVAFFSQKKSSPICSYDYIGGTPCATNANLGYPPGNLNIPQKEKFGKLSTQKVPAGRGQWTLPWRLTWNLKITQELKRSIIFHPPPFLGSMLIFRGVLFQGYPHFPVDFSPPMSSEFTRSFWISTTWWNPGSKGKRYDISIISRNLNQMTYIYKIC